MFSVTDAPEHSRLSLWWCLLLLSYLHGHICSSCGPRNCPLGLSFRGSYRWTSVPSPLCHHLATLFSNLLAIRSLQLCFSEPHLPLFTSLFTRTLAASLHFGNHLQTLWFLILPQLRYVLCRTLLILERQETKAHRFVERAQGEDVSLGYRSSHSGPKTLRVLGQLECGRHEGKVPLTGRKLNMEDSLALGLQNHLSVTKVEGNDCLWILSLFCFSFWNGIKADSPSFSTSPLKRKILHLRRQSLHVGTDYTFLGRRHLCKHLPWGGNHRKFLWKKWR